LLNIVVGATLSTSSLTVMTHYTVLLMRGQPVPKHLTLRMHERLCSLAKMSVEIDKAHIGSLHDILETVTDMILRKVFCDVNPIFDNLCTS
jgi:hypothetical protein